MSDFIFPSNEPRHDQSTGAHHQVPDADGQPEAGAQQSNWNGRAADGGPQRAVGGSFLEDTDPNEVTMVHGQYFTDTGAVQVVPVESSEPRWTPPAGSPAAAASGYEQPPAQQAHDRQYAPAHPQQARPASQPQFQPPAQPQYAQHPQQQPQVQRPGNPAPAAAPVAAQPNPAGTFGLQSGSSSAGPLLPESPRRTRRAEPDRGWRKYVFAATFGLINPGPSIKQEHDEHVDEMIRRTLTGVHKIAVMSVGGGVGKTTVTVGLGSTIASKRGDRVIAVDTDTDMGNLSRRFSERGATIEHVAAMQDHWQYSNVRQYTAQNIDRLEMLGSQNDPASKYTLNSQDYSTTVSILQTHYNVVLLDCGTSITSPLFQTIATDVAGLVVVAAVNDKGVRAADDTIKWLKAHGYQQLLQHTVVVLNGTDRGRAMIDAEQWENYFRDLLPRNEAIHGERVLAIPYDKHLAEGQAVELEALRSKTRKAFVALAGAVAEFYPVSPGRGGA